MEEKPNFGLILRMFATPLDAKHFAPNFTPLPPRQLTWIGRLVHWVRTAENHSLIYKSSVVAFAIFASILLIASVIGIPFFLLCFKEFIRQEQRSIYDAKFDTYTKLAADQNRHFYLRGVTGAIQDTGRITLSGTLRNQLIHELQIPEDVAKNRSDAQLLQDAATSHPDPDWITRYGFTLRA